MGLWVWRSEIICQVGMVTFLYISEQNMEMDTNTAYTILAHLMSWIRVIKRNKMCIDTGDTISIIFTYGMSNRCENYRAALICTS